MEDGFFKIGTEYIKLSKIYQMKTLEFDLTRPYQQYLRGYINGKEYAEHICVSQCVDLFDEIKKKEFYKEYTKLWKAFLEYNSLKDIGEEP